MKLNKVLLGTAALAAATSMAFAQTATLHGSVDATAYGVTQAFSSEDVYTDEDGNAQSYSSATAGLDEDSELTADLTVKAANFEFNLGVKLYTGLDDDTDDYTDYTDSYDGTPFYQGNMKIDFFNQQLSVYTGKFEDFNAGYITEGSVFGSQNIRDLASSGEGQYLTGINVSPYAVKGLSAFVGFPILPGDGNGVNTDIESNYWKNLIKKVKFMAGYNMEGLANFTAGFRPGTYYTGVSSHQSDTDEDGNTGFLYNNFGEGFVQAVFNPEVLAGIPLNASYDIRYRTDASYTTTTLLTEEHTATAHTLSLSADISSLVGMEGLTLAVENRTYYYDDDYLVSDEKLLMNRLGASAAYNLPGTQFTVGGVLAGTYAADANGTAFTASNGSIGYLYIDNSCADDTQLGYNDMTTAYVAATGESVKYLAFYLNPYFQVNFNNGAFRVGAEVQYSAAIGKDDTVSAFAYRIPVGINFAF